MNEVGLIVRTLTDVGRAAVEVAAWIAAFVAGARRSLELAHHDFHLGIETAAIVSRAIVDAARRGVAVRFVADDVVFLGSFNLSRSGELNAENVLEIEDAALAERLAALVDEVRARYPRFVLDGAAPA